MSRITISTELGPHKLEAKILMDRDGETLAQAVFDASGLEAVIQILAARREQMAEAVPPCLEPGARVHGTQDPGWMVTRNDETTQLLLRHPGYGWIGFVLSKDDAAAIARELGR